MTIRQRCAVRVGELVAAVRSGRASLWTTVVHGGFVQRATTCAQAHKSRDRPMFGVSKRRMPASFATPSPRSSITSSTRCSTGPVADHAQLSLHVIDPAAPHSMCTAVAVTAVPEYTSFWLSGTTNSLIVIVVPIAPYVPELNVTLGNAWSHV